MADLHQVRWDVSSVHKVDSSACFTAELKSFAQYVQLTSVERTARQKIINEVTSRVRLAHPLAKVSQFGSFPLGLSVFLSDLDLSVEVGIPALKQTGNSSLEPPNQLQKKEVVDILWNLLREMRRNSLWLNDSKFIKWARVPIIIAAHESGIKFDVCVNGSQSAGVIIMPTLLERSGPALGYLSAFLKVFLNQRDLDEPAEGGLGSFATYMLITTHIHRHPQLVRDAQHPQLGPLLLSLLKYYSSPENLNNETVFTVEGEDSIALKLINVYRVKNVRQAFHEAYVKISLHQESLAGATEEEELTPTQRSTLAAVLDVPKLNQTRAKLTRTIEAFLRSPRKHRRTAPVPTATTVPSASTAPTTPTTVLSVSIAPTTPTTAPTTPTTAPPVPTVPVPPPVVVQNPLDNYLRVLSRNEKKSEVLGIANYVPPSRTGTSSGGSFSGSENSVGGRRSYCTSTLAYSVRVGASQQPLPFPIRTLPAVRFLPPLAAPLSGCSATSYTRVVGLMCRKYFMRVLR